MGAVAALLYASFWKEEAQDLVCCMILDSPFCSLRRVTEELVQQQFAAAILSSLLHFSFKSLRKNIVKKALFDIKDLEIEHYVDTLTIPVLFLHGLEDKFVPPQHSLILHNNYQGKTKSHVLVRGDHNSPRGLDFLEQVTNFIFKTIFKGKSKEITKPISVFGPNENPENLHFYCRHKIVKQSQLPLQENDENTIDQKLTHVILILTEKEVRCIEPFSGHLYWNLTLDSIKNYVVIKEGVFAIVLGDESYVLFSDEACEIEKRIKELKKKTLDKYNDDIDLMSSIENIVRKIVINLCNRGQELDPQRICSDIMVTLEQLMFGISFDKTQMEVDVLQLVMKVVTEHKNKIS